MVDQKDLKWFIGGLCAVLLVLATALGAMIDNRFDQQDRRLDSIEVSIRAINHDDRPRVSVVETKVESIESTLQEIQQLLEREHR